MKDQRGLCEEALLKVKGVISFTFQMASKRCTVRIRSDLSTEVTHKNTKTNIYYQHLYDCIFKATWCRNLE